MAFKNHTSFLSYLILAVICLGSFKTQAQTPNKYYFLMHPSIEGVTLLPCEPKIAQYYSFIDLYTVNSKEISYYYLDGKKFMVESYVGTRLNSRKTFHPNGKKALVEKLVNVTVGSAGSYDGVNMSLFYEQFKVVTAWDTVGNKTLKNGVGHYNFHDDKGNLICQKKYINRANSNFLASFNIYYSNKQLMLESNYKTGIKYVFSEKGDTLIKEGNGIYTSKFANDTVYAHFNFGRVLQSIGYINNYNSSIKHYPNGNKIFEILLNGKHVYYYYNGQILAEGFLKKGYKQGDWKWYDKNGKGINQKTFEKFDLFSDAVK